MTRHYGYLLYNRSAENIIKFDSLFKKLLKMFYVFEKCLDNLGEAQAKTAKDDIPKDMKTAHFKTINYRESTMFLNFLKQRIDTTS